MHCILINFMNTPRFQIIYNCIDVSRHSLERINRLSTISYGKYCFTFLANELSNRFLERIAFDIRGSIVHDNLSFMMFTNYQYCICISWAKFIHYNTYQISNLYSPTYNKSNDRNVFRITLCHNSWRKSPR